MSHRAPPRSTGAGAGTVACIVLAHRAPEQVAGLVEALAHPQVSVLLHVDARVDPGAFLDAVGRTGAPAPALVPPHPTRWGGPELVDATLDGLRMARAGGCGHALLLSGQDGLVWPVARLVDFFREAGDRSYLASFPLPDDRWRLGGRVRTDCYTYTVFGRRETYLPPGTGAGPTSVRGRVLNAALGVRSFFRPPRRFPDCARPFGGSQWWNLSASAADHVLDFVDRHPEYRAYHEHTLIPDEMFFHSVVVGTDFAKDHEVVNRSLRYEVWPPDASHPEVLRTGDLPAVWAADEPFARKFDDAVDPEALRRLHRHAGNDAGRAEPTDPVERPDDGRGRREDAPDA